MKNLTIKKAKEVREHLNMRAIVIFALDNDGIDHVITHGCNKKYSALASEYGNTLKKAIGFPSELCESKPLERICKNCEYWKADYGSFCFNGWSKDGNTGFCRYEPRHVSTTSDNVCGHFEPNC